MGLKRVAGQSSETRQGSPWRRLGSPMEFLLIGLVLGVSVAPRPLWGLQWLALSYFAFRWTQPVSVKESMIRGFALGLGWMGYSVSWVYISMHVYGQMPMVLAALATALFCGGLALFPAMGLGVARALSDRRYSWVLGLGLAEIARSEVLTGFPWAALGYAQLDGPLEGWFAVVGVQGVSGMAMLLSAATAGLAQQLWTSRAFRFGENRAALAIVLVVLVGGLVGRELDYTKPHGTPIKVGLVQTQIEQSLKFDPERLQLDLQHFLRTIATAPVDVVIFPETALASLSSSLPPVWLDELQHVIAQRKVHVLLGVAHDRAEGVSNSMVYLTPTTPRLAENLPAWEQVARYDKVHLVPFGEYIPFGFQWFVRMMNVPLGEFLSGKADQASLVVRSGAELGDPTGPGQRLSVSICYEDAFGRELLPRSRSATILLNVSNLGWFGDSLALPQHAAIGRARALENARPVLKASNTGVTALIDHRGQIQAALSTFQEGLLQVEVLGRDGTTPYQRWGDAPVWLALLLWFGVLGYRSWRR